MRILRSSVTSVDCSQPDLETVADSSSPTDRSAVRTCREANRTRRSTEGSTRSRDIEMPHRVPAFCDSCRHRPTMQRGMDVQNSSNWLQYPASLSAIRTPRWRSVTPLKLTRATVTCENCLSANRRQNVYLFIDISDLRSADKRSSPFSLYCLGLGKWTINHAIVKDV